MESLLVIFLLLLTIFCLVGGVFFMLVGAVGVVRLPDVYCRSHASSKCVTLGIIGLLGALVFFVATIGNVDQIQAADSWAAEAQLEIKTDSKASGGAPGIVALTKALLVVAFVFIAAPIGSHMLARAAHRAKVAMWPGSLVDELSDDEKADQPPSASHRQ